MAEQLMDALARMPPLLQELVLAPLRLLLRTALLLSAQRCKYVQVYCWV